MSAQPLAVGLMIPINNTTMEPELLAWLPEGSSCHRIGIPRGRSMLTPESLPEYLSNAVALAADFKDEDIDLVVYGCTAAGFMSGPQGDAEVAEALRAKTGKRVVTTASSMGAVLQHLGARRVALITPYPDAVNERLLGFLQPVGVEVAVLSSFRAENVDELEAITADQIAARAREVMEPGIDAMFIACSQLPTRAIVLDLERGLGVPVWSSIRATAWQALRATETA